MRDKLKDEEIDILICSPLKRAKHTAEIINELKTADNSVFISAKTSKGIEELKNKLEKMLF